MTRYIKIKYREEVYGSLRAPTTLSLLCSVLQVSPRSSPMLVSLENSSLVISDLEADVKSGFYELIHRRDIPFDPALDPMPHLFIKKRALHPRIHSSKHNQDSSESHQESSLPLPDSEMNTAIHAMLHIISSIPPRYFKYNVVLAHQVEKAISEVDRIHKLLKEVQSKPQEFLASQSHSKAASLPLAIHTTFIQYRILHLLYETWKMVWEKQSPVCRYFRISDVKTLESIEIAEHYLNRLNSWRRILELNTWNHLTSTIPKESLSKFHVQPEPRMYRPPGLGSNRNPRAWTYLVKPSKTELHSTLHESNGIPIKVLNENETLNAFRTMYIDGVLTHRLVKDEELNVLLNKMMELDKEFKSFSDDKDYPAKVVYPSGLIRDTIKKEFKIK